MSAVRIGWDEIKSGYKVYQDYPFYALFDSNGRGKMGRLIYAYKGNDLKGQGWDMLEENLKVAEINTPSTEYVIQFYDQLGKNDKLDSSTPYAGSFNLKMKPYDRAVSTVSGISAADTSFLAYLQTELRLEKEKNLELEETIRELQEENDELSKEPKKAIGGIIGQIGEAGNQFPWIADIFKDLSTVFKRYAGPVTNPRMAGAGINGIPADAPPDKLVNDAIGRMVSWYIKEYGQGTTEEERKISGFRQFAADMQCLANLTSDTDTMQLALKKLRAF